MIAEHVRVAIVGGGPGGLALAQGLVKNGIGVAVFEKDRARADYVQGFRLRVRSEGLEALRECLPPPLFAAFQDTAGRAPPRSAMVTDQLQPLAEEGDAYARDWNADGLADWSVSRITLRQILLSGIEDRVHTGWQFVRYEELPDGRIAAHFADGRSITCDILVGADGAASTVRGQLVPEAATFDTGVRRIAGKMTIAEAEERRLSRWLLDYNLQIRAEDGRSLHVTSHLIDPAAYAAWGLIGGDDATHQGIDGFHFNNTTSYVWWNFAATAASFGADEAVRRLSGAELIGLACRYFSGFHPEIIKLLRHSDPSTVALLRVRSSVPVEPWETRRATLLGDAIHSMTYFRASGCNTALYDAGLLTRALAGLGAGGDVVAALHAYEAAMLEHGFAIVQASLAGMQKAVGLPDLPRAT